MFHVISFFMYLDKRYFSLLFFQTSRRCHWSWNVDEARISLYCIVSGVISNLPWFMDLTFQISMQYCSLQHWTLLVSAVPSTPGSCFLLWLHPFILSGVISPLISSSILGTYRPGEFIFQCPIFLPFHTVYGVLKARILKWFAIPFSRGPHSVRPLHHDPPVLGSPTWHGLVSLS